MYPPAKRRASRSPPPHQLAPIVPSDASAPEASGSAHHPTLCRVHEATLITGCSALATEIAARQEHGGRLTRWQGYKDENDEDLWIDRYDILHLLPTLPPHLPFTNSASFPFDSSAAARPGSAFDERGFSDLGSDHEEEFYFRQLPREEREELEKKRKRQRLERGREERMRLLAEQEAGMQSPHRPDTLEETEPSETQLSLMKKLHSTLKGAQNPSLLEMRILTNHANDPKFQFLKTGGKWRDVWERIRRGEAVEASKQQKPDKPAGGGLAGLGDYGSSESESEEEEEPSAEPEATVEGLLEDTGQGVDEEDTRKGSIESEKVPDGNDEAERRRKEAKAEKVREWARKRKEAREEESRS